MQKFGRFCIINFRVVLGTPASLLSSAAGSPKGVKAAADMRIFTKLLVRAPAVLAGFLFYPSVCGERGNKLLTLTGGLQHNGEYREAA